MNRKYNDSQIIELHSKGLTDREIAEIIGVSPNNMATKRRRLGLKPNKSKRDTYKLSKYEESILIGTLLGDATIRYTHNKCKYPNLTFSHCVKQREYFDWLTNKLKNLKASVGEYKSKYIRTNGESTTRLVYTGRNMKCLKDIRDIFYPCGEKIIPIEYIKDKFNEVSLYCLFMDDGSYDINSHSFILNTQCFSKEDLEDFCEFLYDKFNLSFNIKADNSLYLCHKSNEILRDILKRRNKCDSMNYKYGGHHKTPLNRETDVDNPVLNLQETEENAERLEVTPNK